VQLLVLEQRQFRGFTISGMSGRSARQQALKRC
jgi:hypothetical protein